MQKSNLKKMKREWRKMQQKIERAKLELIKRNKEINKITDIKQ